MSEQLQLFPELRINYPGVVYYGAGPDGSIKIGYTTRPTGSRMYELDCLLIYKIPGGPLDEKRHLRRWRHCRVGTSEWHRPIDELLIWLISRVIERDQHDGAEILKWLTDARRAGWIAA